MRTSTHNGLALQYPDFFVLQHDKNIVTARCSSTFSTLELIVAVGGRTLSYKSVCSVVAIDASQLLLMVNGTTTINMTVNRTYSDGGGGRELIETFTASASCYCANGRTLPDWFPCTGRKVYVPSGVGVEIPLKGAAQVNGESYMLGGIITRTVRGSGVINIVYNDSETQVGRPWDETDGETTFKVEVVGCLTEDGCFIEWIDSDGCKRYAPARLLSDSSGAAGTPYLDYDGVVPVASRHIGSAERKITVSLTNIAAEVRLSDVAFSPLVRISDGENGVFVTPAFESIESTMKNKSYTLTFNVL